MMKQLTTMLFFVICMAKVFAQQTMPANIKLENRIYHSDILSMKMEKDEAMFKIPAIRLNSGETLTLKFDDKSDNPKYLKYTLIHCTYDWQMTENLSKNDFLGMFEETEVTDFQTSINTIQFYIAYSITIPNNDITITKSGNYILYVYDGDTEEPILTHRFYVYENNVNVSVAAQPATDVSRKLTHQQLTATISNPHFRILSPSRYLKVLFMQNGRSDNAILLSQPTLVLADKIIYNKADEVLFEGGNEFRTFNIRTLKTTMEQVARHDYVANANYTFLYPDKERSHLAYENYKDINGCYFIASDDGDSLYGADYTEVHFYLQADKPADADFYVYGELTNWNLIPEARMTYNDYRHCWEASLYLKSGYYNYTYITKPTYGNTGSMAYVEGNHWETENNYHTFVYYQGDNLGYDRIIGYYEFVTE